MTSNDSLPRYLTLQEVAELTNLPMTYIYRLSSEDRLPGKVVWGRRTVRVDKKILIENIEKFTKNHRN